MSDRYEPAAAPSRNARELHGKPEMRLALWALIAVLGAATLVGSGQTAAASGHAVVASTPRCPAGWQWQPSRYNRWSVWHPGHCELGRR